MQEQEIIARIKELCAVRGWTVYRLAKQSGITYSTLCTMLHKATAPSVPTLVKICRGFGISLPEFFDTDNDWATLSAEEMQHLQQWRLLNRTNKDATEKYVAYLLSEQKNSGQDQTTV